MATQRGPPPVPPRRRRRNVLQNAPQLQRFVLHNVRATGRELGHGSYGVVEELEINGLVCAGKKIYEVLVNQAYEGAENAVRKYVEECELLSNMRHPHIVQFLGLCFMEDTSLPVLVMEMLMKSLDDLLEGTPNIPLSLKRSMLADVAKGLLYLHKHNPAIVHRDLSAKNVLLNSALVAKISDLGNSRIVSLQPNQLAKTLTKGPGTMVYMPPEALYSAPGTDPNKSRYGVKIDVFSFGHLALFTATQVFPHDLLAPTRPDPQNPGRLVGLSEVERRRDYIGQLHQQLGRGHPLVQLITQCLDNDPARRPSAEEILQQLDGMEIEDPYQNLTKLEMIGLVRQKEEEIRQKDVALRQKDEEIRRKDEAIRQVDRQPRQPPQSGATNVQPHILHPRAKLHWKKCGDLPVAMGGQQCVLIDGRVYVGGGVTMEADKFLFQVFEYSPRGDEWTSLPNSAVSLFAMGQFQGHLITVGGLNENEAVSGRVYQYRKQSRKWREFLKPLPTARGSLSITTTDSAIVACGGFVGEDKCCATVEVYTRETDLWHTTDPLPIGCCAMTSITIANTLYLLGGADASGEDTKSVLCASVPSLISKAVSRPQQPTGSSQHGGATCASVWKTLPDTPMQASAGASLGGCLLTLGGFTEEGKEVQSAIHVFIPPTNTWVKLTSGELPTSLNGHTAVQLSDSELLVCGAVDDKDADVYIGSTTLADD